MRRLVSDKQYIILCSDTSLIIHFLHREFLGYLSEPLDILDVQNMLEGISFQIYCDDGTKTLHSSIFLKIFRVL